MRFPILLLPPLLLLASCAARARVELVETAPIETSLDHPELREAAEVWVERIAAARSTLDFAEFYASDQPGSRLGPVIEALVAAAGRGVRVRFLADRRFERTYPDTLALLRGTPGTEVRILDLGPYSGGVLHAKYFVADGREVFVGSQNFDWRSLEHIQELGLLVQAPAVARAFEAVFAYDWNLPWGGGRTPLASGAAGAERFPEDARCAGGPIGITPVFSPRDWLPDESLWDLPRLVECIRSAERSVHVQLLTYKAGPDFQELEQALLEAAGRGVEVRLLLSDWCKRRGTIEGLQRLEPVENLEIRLVSLPEWSGGFLPFARTIHAKYMVVDGIRSWVGTANWDRDYFYESRNAGILAEGAALGGALERFFRDGWESPYAAPVDPSARYEPPRVRE